MEWLCWHVGTITDPKFVAVAKRAQVARPFVISVWAYLLERAKQADEPGTFGKICPEDCAIATDVSEDEVVRILAAFETKGLISDGKIVNWVKRNHKTSTERVREHRNRKKHDETNETVPPVPVTPETVSETPRNDETPTGHNRTGQDNAADDARAAHAKAVDAVLDALGVRKDPRWFGDGGRVATWLAQGADLELDILPTVRRLMAKRGEQGAPRSLNYFDQAVADSLANRTKPLPEARPPPAGAKTRSDADFSRAIDAKFATALEKPPDAREN